MASNTKGDSSSDRDSIAYDDVVSSGDLSNEEAAPAENVQKRGDASPFEGKGTMQTQNKDLRGQNETENLKTADGGKDADNENDSSKVLSKPNDIESNDQGSRNDRLKNCKENGKEQWTPVKADLNKNKDGKGFIAEAKTENDSSPQVPSRRQPRKRASNDMEQKTSLSHTPEGDPVKPPRRRLPPVPNSAEPKADQKSSSDEGDVLSVTSNDSGEQKLEEIICKPVLTSSPNQDELPSLTVENNVMDTSRKVLSFMDVSSEGGVRKVESFYDFLYSQEGADVSKERSTSPILVQRRDTIGSALSGSQEHLYDDVPRDSSVAQSWKSNGTYDEVIVNREAYVMPSHDDESDDYSENDPWGSDFETEDDITYGGSIRTQDGFIDEEEEEDPYDTVEISPMRERKRPFQFVSEIANFSPFSTGKKSSLTSPGLKAQFKGCLGLNRVPSIPYLASNSQKENEEANAVYVDPDITDSVNYQQPVMPPMPEGLSNEQIKRYQIVKFMLESEADYMRLLDQLSKQYELPIRERDLLEPNKIDIIFQHVHRVLQCHAMFNIALSARMSDWTPDMKVGDILYALFCKSMVLDAYSGYVNNFAKAMDTVKVACRTHLAFAQFLKSRRQSSLDHLSLHNLMLRPIHRFPQILALLQELLVVTPRDHPDRVPLQLALTQLECLAESLRERKREAELRNKVKLLDGLVAQSHKTLASGNRYFIRQDDFVQCNVEGESILGTKKRRIIMLSDMLLCVSLIKGKKDRAMHMVIDPKAKYKLKWNVPLSDVNIVEYGPGVNILTNSYRTTIKHSNEGQYRSAYSGCREHFEDLQQDLAIIGQIAGLVSTLRRSYQVLDMEKVQKWHKAVQRTIEEETRLANLYWLELSLPSKNGNVNYIFSTDSPTVKAEWVTALNTSKLRLAPENNPGWYLPEDDGTGGVAVQRRNMPLLKDNSNLFMLNQRAKIQCIVSCPDISDSLPGVHDNYNILWLLCGSGDNAGHVSVVKVSLATPPQVVESFHVCESNILCGAYMERTCGEEKKFKGTVSGRFGFPFPTVWLGTQGGRIFIYNAANATRRYVMSVKLPDAVLQIKTINMKIFAAVADGSVIIFKRNQAGTWNFSEPKAVGLSKAPVMAMAAVKENLWCSCGNKLFILDCNEEIIKHVIEVDENPKTSIKLLVCYGVGVWVSVWKQPSIKLFHSETLKHVQDISIASPVTNMQRDIDSQLEKTKLDQVYATALAADEGLLWVGTSVGVTLVFPLPQLEGIPLVSGRACVAFHSYGSSVRCFYPLKNNPNLGTGQGPDTNNVDSSLFRENEVRDACVQTDAGISGVWSHASRGSALANQSNASPTKDSDRAKGQTTDREDEEDLSDEDVDSDDEFNFVEDKQQTLTGVQIRSSVGTASSSDSFKIKFEGTEESANSLLRSSVHSDDVVGKTEFRVDDFARMLSEFKGFGSHPTTSVPEPPQIPLNLLSDQAHSKGGTLSEGQESGKASASTDETVGSGFALGQAEIGSGSEDAASRDRVLSVGENVKLNDAHATAKAHGSNFETGSESAGESSGSKGDEPSDLLPEVENKAGNDGGTGNLEVGSFATPAYLEVLRDSDSRAVKSPETAKTSDVIYDSPRQDDSYSVFDRSQLQYYTTGSTAKVENLKPRLPFPVLFVSAGEGYADLRRKRRDENDKEPRLMIWQII